jgi:hypothetical protein
MFHAFIDFELMYEMKDTKFILIFHHIKLELNSNPYTEKG